MTHQSRYWNAGALSLCLEIQGREPPVWCERVVKGYASDSSHEEQKLKMEEVIDCWKSKRPSFETVRSSHRRNSAEGVE